MGKIFVDACGTARKGCLYTDRIQAGNFNNLENHVLPNLPFWLTKRLAIIRYKTVLGENPTTLKILNTILREN